MVERQDEHHFEASSDHQALITQIQDEFGLSEKTPDKCFDLAQRIFSEEAPTQQQREAANILVDDLFDYVALDLLSRDEGEPARFTSDHINQWC